MVSHSWTEEGLRESRETDSTSKSALIIVSFRPLFFVNGKVWNVGISVILGGKYSLSNLTFRLQHVFIFLFTFYVYMGYDRRKRL